MALFQNLFIVALLIVGSAFLSISGISLGTSRKVELRLPGEGGRIPMPGGYWRCRTS